MKIALCFALVFLSACTVTPPTIDNPTVFWPVQKNQMTAAHWLAKAKQPQRPILNSAAVAELNQEIQNNNSSLYDLSKLPQRFTRDYVLSLINRISKKPSYTLYDESGKEVVSTQLDSLLENLNLSIVPNEVVPQFALVVKRTDLRAFPSMFSVFKSSNDHDIDRFQESNLFPGNAVVVLHSSGDGHWHFVLSSNYSAWIKSEHIAIGEREAVLAYIQKSPALVITAAQIKTVFSPETPAVSELNLDMGNRYPVLPNENSEINGQASFAHHVIELPTRDPSGKLLFTPALLPINSDVSENYLPFSESSIITQAFKFLGERYGWGHRYQGRDCSGFVGEVYRSMGLSLPRNTSDQARNMAVQTRTLNNQDNFETRLQLLRETKIGDLIFIPGHVMMVIGHQHGEIFVIHDTAGIGLLDQVKRYKSYKLNGVYVTPLLALMSNQQTPTLMNITAIQRLTPSGPSK